MPVASATAARLVTARATAALARSVATAVPAAAPAATAAPSVSVLGKNYPTDAWTNVSPSILARTARRIHLDQNHPIGILKHRIQHHLTARSPGTYAIVDSLDPVVSTTQNFDELLIAPGHPGRQRSDSYYINASTLLRTHTSAHQSEVLRSKAADGYLLTADVYRRDEIDPTHYPIFHQMEGIRTFDRSVVTGSGADPASSHLASSPQSSTSSLDMAAAHHRLLGASESNPVQPQHSIAEAAFLANDLKTTLKTLIRDLLVSERDLQIRWIDAYFPFTSPSWELEVFYRGKWLELFGCGIIQQRILNDTGNASKIGWAFGLGLERIAMPLFRIPDIRLFWTTDHRFTSQFHKDRVDTVFVPFSKYPACYKDVSFWTSSSGFHDHDFMEIVRDVAGDIAEEVTMIDEFKHPKTGRTSRCYRINYRSMERTLTNVEIDAIQNRIRQAVVDRCGVELR